MGRRHASRNRCVVSKPFAHLQFAWKIGLSEPDGRLPLPRLAIHGQGCLRPLGLQEQALSQLVLLSSCRRRGLHAHIAGNSRFSGTAKSASKSPDRMDGRKQP